MFGESIHHFAAGGAGCHWFIGGLPFREIGVPVLRELVVNYALELGGLLWERSLVCVELLSPLVLHIRAARERLAEILHGVLRQVELVHTRPPECFLGG